MEMSTPLKPFGSGKRMATCLVQTPGKPSHELLTPEIRLAYSGELSMTSVVSVSPIFNTSDLPAADAGRFIDEIFTTPQLQDIFVSSMELPNNWLSIKRVLDDSRDADTSDSDENNGYVYKCMYHPARRLFYLLILDADVPPDTRRGASKHVSIANFFFIINAAVPLWRYFIHCEGDFRVVRGWRVVAMTPSSPAFQKLDGNREQLLALIKELSDDDFMACPASTSSEVPTFIAPFKGISLAEIRESSEGADLLKKPAFLENLVNFILQEIENDFDRYDLKPHNILYNETNATFSWIDYKQTKPTFAFLLPGCPKLDTSALSPQDKNRITGCLSPLANCLVNTVRYLLSDDPDIFSDSALIPTMQFWEYYWQKYGLVTRPHIFYRLLRESIDCIHEKIQKM